MYEVGDRVEANLGRGRDLWYEGTINAPGVEPGTYWVDIDELSGSFRFPHRKLRPLDNEPETPELRKYVILMAVKRDWQGEGLDNMARLVACQLQDNTNIPDGSVQPQVGFGNWGVEDGVRIEVATTEHSAVKGAVEYLLWKHEQECAYVEVDGEPQEWSKPDELHKAVEISPIVGNYN